MNLWPNSADLVCHPQNERMVLGLREAPYVPDHGYPLRNSRFTTNLIPVNAYSERLQIYPEVEDTKTLIKRRCGAEKRTNCILGTGQAVRGVLPDPSFHPPTIEAAPQRSPFPVAGSMAVGDADGNSFGVGPTEDGAGKMVDMAVHNIVGTFTQEAAEAASERQRVAA